MIADIDAAPYGVLIAMAVQDSSRDVPFDDNDVAYLEDLGAGGQDCPIRLGTSTDIFVKAYLKHILYC